MDFSASTKSPMALLSVLAFVATLLITTECVQQSIPPIVISGSNGIGSCPAEDALEMAKQNISATIREMIAGMKFYSYRYIRSSIVSIVMYVCIAVWLCLT